MNQAGQFILAARSAAAASRCRMRASIRPSGFPGTLQAEPCSSCTRDRISCGGINSGGFITAISSATVFVRFLPGSVDPARREHASERGKLTGTRTAQVR